MSVQIIENWSNVMGVVVSCNPSSDVGGFMAIEVVLEKIDPVEGYANLLEHKQGKTLVILVPEELVKQLDITPGIVIVCRVRRADLDRVFVHRNYISVLARDEK